MHATGEHEPALPTDTDPARDQRTVGAGRRTGPPTRRQPITSSSAVRRWVLDVVSV